ncbi:PP2C-domain-containing protein [Saitoella complicata NRRL Y-17804]|nr:PP2C-domain-containing protein [Saitoella complicata NRRL Y-17804]ODQ55121.1 PP2C-domain-containing protein [Saitoella complicata NRRL Y-17804]
MNPFSSSNSSADKFGSSPTSTRSGDSTGNSDGKKTKKKSSDDEVINSAGEAAGQPTSTSTFRVGVAEDKNRKCRRTMEDTHAYIYDYASVPDQGYFAIFDGHAGKQAADWCGSNFHKVLADMIAQNQSTPIPDLLDRTFTSVDKSLEKICKNSGCTAVTALLRWEDRIMRRPSNPAGRGNTASPVPIDELTEKVAAREAVNNPSLTVGSTEEAPRPERRRVLYTANAGDARVVLARGGQALRLSYDHKGSDLYESKRVSDAGGLMLNNRVNGVLAVTRALGDSYLKDLVTGHPYTTETVLIAREDEFIILACDGLWDVCSDQEAVELVRGVPDPQEASRVLVEHALSRFSTDNLSCMVVRLNWVEPQASALSPAAEQPQPQPLVQGEQAAVVPQQLNQAQPPRQGGTLTQQLVEESERLSAQVPENGPALVTGPASKA